MVVADTSWGLTCHTRSATHPCLPSPPILLLCSSSKSILASGPRYPYHQLVGFPFPPFPPLSLSHLALPLPRNATPARQRRYPWADTGDARASLHLRSTLRALLSHRLEAAYDASPSPAGSSTSPTTLRVPSLFLLALSRAGKITIVPVSLSRSRFLLPSPLSSHLDCVQHAVGSSEHPRCTSVTPVIVRLLTGTYANDMPGASRLVTARVHVFTRALRVTRGRVGSLLRPTATSKSVLSSSDGIEARMMPRRHARAQARRLCRQLIASLAETGK